MSLANYFQQISPATDNFLNSDYDELLSSLDISALTNQQNDVIVPNITSNVLLTPVECKNMIAENPTVREAIKKSGSKSKAGKKTLVRQNPRKTPMKKPRRNNGKILRDYLQNHTAVSNTFEIDLTNQSPATNQEAPLFSIEDERLLVNVSILRKGLNASLRTVSDDIDNIKKEITEKNALLSELLITHESLKNKMVRMQSYFND